MCLTSSNLGQHGAPVDAVTADEKATESLRHWLDDRESDHGLLLYVADDDDTSWSRLCVRQADVVLLLADAGDDPAPRDWERRLLNGEGASTARCALLLRHPSFLHRDELYHITNRWLADREIEFHLHIRDGVPDDFGRLVRILMGDSVGLVLGGGAARGFAEVGAYRALHEAGVPIDWVGGTSIGGIIGAAIALETAKIRI